MSQLWECGVHLSCRSAPNVSHLILAMGKINRDSSITKGARNTASHFITLTFSKKAWAQIVAIFNQILINLKFASESPCSTWIFPHVPAFILWCPHPVWSQSGLCPQSAGPAQYSPCHSLSLCLYSPGPHTVAWVLGEHVLSPRSCHCAPQCQILSGKGPGPRPCCYFWPGKEGGRKGEELEGGWRGRRRLRNENET